MRLSACNFGDVTGVQWLQHIEGRRWADVGCVGCGVVVYYLCAFTDF